MEIVFRNKLGRWSFILIASALFLLAVGWIAKTYIASLYASKNDLKDLQLAIKLDPDNAEYHLQLGSLYEYMPTSAKPEKAMQEFRRAAELDPYNPDVWINLGAAADFAGNIAEAEKYLRQADYVAPRIPIFQWRIGNFFLLHGNVGEAFAHFKTVLAGTREYDQAVFRTAWKASGDSERILRQLIPNDLPAELSYLDYLVSNKQFPEAHVVWKRIMTAPGRFRPDQAGPYIDALIGAHHPGDAFDVWQDLQKKGLVRFTSSDSEQDAISNGSFEDDLLNMGFTWRISPVEGIYAGLDTSTYHSPSHALLVQFPGNQNVDYRQCYQFVNVSPDTSYRLQAYLKTEGITTDSGPRIEVRDAYDSRLLDLFTNDLTGTTEGWTSQILDFKTGPGTDLIVVGLTRLPSKKLDNLISGKVWLDDVRVTMWKN